MSIETTNEGLVELTQKIDELTEKTSHGILNPEVAKRMLMEIRTGLFTLKQIIRNEFTVGPDAGMSPRDNIEGTPETA